MPRRIVRYAAAPALSLALLAGVGAELLSRPRAADADAYHQRVRLAVAMVPLRIGPWVGTDVPVPREAQTLLHPNALLFRDYLNTQTQQRLSLLLVQCRDARDMVGHYPPVCYPNQGWTRATTTATDLQLAGQTVPLTEYDFRMDQLGQTSQLLVYNFMVLPNARLVPNIEEVNRAAADYTQHFFGAAQLQFVFTADHQTREQRLDCVRQFLSALQETLSAIGSGVPS